MSISKVFIVLIWCLVGVLFVVDVQARQDLDNDFLWQAAIAKTSFMTNIHKDRESRRIVAGWTEIDGKLYELNVRIMGKELLLENVKARVRERLRSGQGWGIPQVNKELTLATEAAIFERARVLYDNSLNLN